MTAADLKQRLQLVIKKTFSIFFENLPRNQQATNEMTLEFGRSQLGQARLVKDTEAIKENTSQIGEINKTTQTVQTRYRHLTKYLCCS